jgi:hypothetical protein
LGRKGENAQIGFSGVEEKLESEGYQAKRKD